MIELPIPKGMGSLFNKININERNNKMTWYAKSTGEQGLVIDEETGRNVAVVYDKKDTKTLAASSKMLKICKELLSESERYIQNGMFKGVMLNTDYRDMLMEVISETEY